MSLMTHSRIKQQDVSIEKKSCVKLDVSYVGFPKSGVVFYKDVGNCWTVKLSSENQHVSSRILWLTANIRSDQSTTSSNIKKKC